METVPGGEQGVKHPLHQGAAAEEEFLKPFTEAREIATTIKPIANNRYAVTKTGNAEAAKGQRAAEKNEMTKGKKTKPRRCSSAARLNYIVNLSRDDCSLSSAALRAFAFSALQCPPGNRRAMSELPPRIAGICDTQ